MRDDVQISLGKCYYGDFDEAATATAVREDGTGWIAICEEHRDKAEQDGYKPGEPMDNLEPVTGEGADVPDEEREGESGEKIGTEDGEADESADGSDSGIDDLMHDDADDDEHAEDAEDAEEAEELNALHHDHQAPPEHVRAGRRQGRQGAGL